MPEWDLQTHPPLPQWMRGSVVLIGDACYPMLAYVPQGAAQAIEDSAVLAMVFNQTGDVQLALRVYEAMRKTRGERIAVSASTTRQSLHLSDGPEQRIRDEAIRNVGRANSKNEDKSEKWRDTAWQDYVWGVDVMRETVEKWEELTANLEEHPIPM